MCVKKTPWCRRQIAYKYVPLVLSRTILLSPVDKTVVTSVWFKFKLPQIIPEIGARWIYRSVIVSNKLRNRTLKFFYIYFALRVFAPSLLCSTCATHWCDCLELSAVLPARVEKATDRSGQTEAAAEADSSASDQTAKRVIWYAGVGPARSSHVPVVLYQKKLAMRAYWGILSSLNAVIHY